MKSVLIVFSGKAQSGKSTSAKLVKDILFNKVDEIKIWSFAEPLKKIAHDIFNWDGDKEIYFNGADPEPVSDKGRQLLINIGRHFRMIRPAVWVDLTIKNIKKHKEQNSGKIIIHCIDDLRFKNELQILKSNEFLPCITVRIQRDLGKNITDQSEMDLDDSTFDYYIDNNKDMEELKLKISGLLKDIELKYN